MRVDGTDATPTEAATVMLVRDRIDLEVFLLERHIDSDFVGGAWVFPGGKVDSIDHAIPDRLLAGQAPIPLVDAVGQPLATALTVAAIRETFEESGVLLATATRPIGAERLQQPSFIEARASLAERGSTWNWSDWLSDEDLRLDLSALAWWSWWVTPTGIHRRFDTKFFIAHLPIDQAPLHDDIETTDSRWLRPADALEAAHSGSVSIILPTRKNLEGLAGYPTSLAAVAAATDDLIDRPRIEPTVSVDGGQVFVDHTSFDHREPV